MNTDCIVHPINRRLIVTNGETDVIVNKAGRNQIINDFNTIRKAKNKRLNTGDAISTSGYNLHSKFIIHVVTP